MAPLRVVAAVLEHDGRFLLARRAPGQRHAGVWEFPGGKVESGEDDATALARELDEEFGCRLAVGACLGGAPSGAIRLLAYRVRLPAGSPPLQPVVHDRLAWCRPDELAGYDLHPPDRFFAALVAQATADGRL